MADINGTAGADRLYGAAAADLISGGDGNDVLYGGAGDDHLVGGDGDDVLRGEAGNDLLEGGAGNDDLQSTDQGNDTLRGGEGNDVLFVDRRRAGDSLVLDGGAGNDRLIIQLTAAATALTAAGGDGDDSVEISALRSLLNLSLGAGRDLVTPVGLRASVQGGGSIVISDFQAGAAGDRISFSSLTAGDFTGWNLNANPFAAGFLKAAQSGADVVISASFTANGTFVDAIVLQNVLLASLTADNLGGWTWDGSAVPAQSITGSAAAETLRGNGDADEIFGLGGDDILEGHAGADTLWGGEGNDILRGGQGADQVHGEGGNDTLAAETAGDSLFGGDGNDRLTLSAATGIAAGTMSGSGGAGNDTINISDSSATASFSVDAGSGDDLVNIFSLAGSAVIALGEGRDRLDIDNFTKSPTSTATIEVTDFATGDGGDRLEWIGFLQRTLSAGPGSVRFIQSGVDSLLQIERNGGGYVTLINFRNTEAAAFTIYNLGGFGPDGAVVPGTTVAGTADPDTLFGTDGDDLIEGQDGNDLLLGFFGDDEIHGGAGDDSIFGSYGDDVLAGGDGNDLINPGHGEDLADGGEGNDQFIDNSSSGHGNKGFVGGAGDDSFYFFRQSGSVDALVATGDDGNDFFQVQSFSYAQFFLDGGAGNDIFDVRGRGIVTLGTGVDEIRFTDRSFDTNFQIFVQDFAAGDLGDRLSFAGLVSRFTNFSPAANPFTSGYLKLVQSGSSVMIYADLDGPAGIAQDGFVGVLSGVQKYSLTSHNIGGYGLPFIFGTAADETFQGTALDDDFTGGGGNDIFLLGYGGKDIANGGAGDDLFYVASLNIGNGPSARITGGGGSDILQVQGKSADMYVGLQAATFSGLGGSPITATGIGTVQLLSGFDSSRGWALNSAVSYSVHIADGFAPTGAPLVIDSTRLAASERLNIYSGAVNDADALIKLIGGAGVDRVYAGAGGSHLDGGGGDDELFTGLGSDTLIGGAGADFLKVTASSGSSNTDVVDAGEGNDRVQLAGASGTVTVTLGAGSDTIEFSTGYNPIGDVIGRNVTITDFAAGAGGDSLDWTGDIFDYLVGEYGNPFETGHARLLQDGGDVLLQLSRMADGNFLTLLRLQNHAVADFASGIGGFVVPGNAGDDLLTGTGGDDQLDGGAGNDIIDGGAGADRMTGGSGNDIFYVDNAGDQAIEAEREGTDEIRTGLATYSLAGLWNVEKLTATSDLNHDFRGNSGNNVITGGLGNDNLRLQDGGDDTVLGGGGNDNLFLIGSLTAADVVNGGAGNDTLVLRGHYPDGLALTANVTDIELISILAGSNTNFGGSGGARFDYVLTTHDSNFSGAIQARINGSALLEGEDFTFDGSAELDSRFVVYGGRGKDTLTGTRNNDIFFLAEERFATGDTVNGGAGYDGMFLRGNYTIDFNALGYTGLFTNIENLTLTSATDERYARGGGTEFDYNLVLSDAIVKPGETLTVSGTLLMANETMILDASAEADGFLSLFGGKAGDTLKGGALADLIHGNLGADLLAGNGGADVFRYQGVGESTGSSLDHILDFAAGTDKVDLSRMDSDTATAGNQAFTWIGSNAFSGTAGQLRAYQDGSSWFVEGDTDGGGAADLVIRLTVTGGALTQGDFLP